MEHQTPMHDMLCKARHSARMHMPGHKGKLPAEWLEPGFDTTEIESTDDLFLPETAIKAAQALAAKAAGAAYTQMLTGGCTSAMLIMLLYSVSPGGKIILPRNAHLSALSACVLGGMQPIYVLPRFSPDGLSFIHQGDVLDTITAHPDAKAVLLTRPDYNGVCLDVTPIAAACRQAGMRLLVDEAHGTHLNWRVEGQPLSAGAQGAHLWIQSAHKTLPVLTGGAWLHMGPGESPSRMRLIMRMIHSTSPSFLILNTLDRARDWMDANGQEAIRQLHRNIAAFWEHVKDIEGIFNVHTKIPLETDPSRLVIDVSGRGLTGHQAAAVLEEQGVKVEMADDWRLVLITSVWDEAADFQRLADALRKLPRAEPVVRTIPQMVYGQSFMSVRDAALSEKEWLPLAQSVGRVAAGAVGLYPPGVALLAPGELISLPIVQRIGQAVASGARAFGLMEGAVPCVPMLTEEEIP